MNKKRKESIQNGTKDNNLLMCTVEAGVRLALLNMQKQNIIPDEELFGMARERMEPFRVPGVSEAVFYADKKHTPLVVSILIDSLAVLAHMPGGVDFGGVHFEVEGVA